MCGEIDFFNEVRTDSGGKEVRLTVDYSGNSMPKCCKEPTDCKPPWINPKHRIKYTNQGALRTHHLR